MTSDQDEGVMRTNDEHGRDQPVPDFGVLAGVKVVYAGSALAGPFAAQLLADFGANVVWIENVRSPDMVRTAEGGLAGEQERRNQRTIALDLQRPEGREVLLRLLATADVFLESSRGGQFAGWGLPDEALWAVNERLVVVHVSGFGQDGDPDYVGRASFDAIAQAFGCYLQLNGPTEGPPMPANPFTADYLTALFASTATLAALHRAQQTGRGESVDVAMFEVLLRAGGTGPMQYLNRGTQPVRRGARHTSSAGIGIYRCGDGADVYVVFGGAGVLRKGVAALGLSIDAVVEAGQHFVPLGTPAATRLEDALGAYCAARTAAEVERELSAAGVPCSRVYSYADAEADPHYVARDVFTTWEGHDGRPVRGVNVVPRFARRPGRIWRGLPSVGEDTSAVLREAGFSDSEIAELGTSGVVACRTHPD